MLFDLTNICIGMIVFSGFFAVTIFIYFSGTASTCKQLTNMPTVRDTEWASQNCTLTFNAAGKEY